MEGPRDNENFFSTYWHKGRQPWCADFVTWALDQAQALDVPQSSYTPTLAQSYRDARRWGEAPVVGAVVFFQWPGMGRIAHVGLVESIRPDGSIVTVEGNTDVKGGRTGGKVMRKVRRANIAGYGYPKYNPAAPKPAPAPDVNPYYRRVLTRGMYGSDVRAFKHALKVPIAPGPEGNAWNHDLEVALRKFQHAQKWTPNNRIAGREARILR